MSMRKVLTILLNDQEGQGMVEYGLIISLVILAVIGAVELFGIRVEELFEHIREKTSDAL